MQVDLETTEVRATIAFTDDEKRLIKATLKKWLTENGHYDNLDFVFMVQKCLDKKKGLRDIVHVRSTRATQPLVITVSAPTAPKTAAQGLIDRTRSLLTEAVNECLAELKRLNK